MCQGVNSERVGDELDYITLDKIKKKSLARIVRINTSLTLRRQLMRLGLLPGTVIQKIRTAPLGDPVEYHLFGQYLCLRKQEADCIEVELLTRDT